MKADPVIEELWSIKDKLSGEMKADPAAYLAKLDQMSANEVGKGRRIILSADELRQFVADQENQRAPSSPFALNEKPPEV